MSDIAQASRSGRAAGRPLAARLGSFAMWVFCVVVIVCGAIFFAPKLSIRWLQDLVGAGGLLLSVATIWFAVAFSLAAVIAVLSWQGRRWWRLAAGTLAAVVALVVVLVPWLAAWRTAHSLGESVSWFSFPDDGPHRSPTQTTTFATVDGQALRLDVYRTALPTSQHPAVVYVHGGGWTRGNRGDSTRWFTWLATQGVTVFSVDYRLAPPPRWQQATGDVKCALGWVRGHAAEYGVNGDNVSVAGDSAGANLALMAAYTVGDPQFPPSCPVPEAPVRSVISLYAPTDLPAALHDTRMPDTAEHLLDDYIGGDIDHYRERYLAASPIGHVASGLPPTFLVQGGSDHLVPPDQADRLATALTAAGAPARTLDLPWVDHGFTGQWGSWGSQLLRPQLSRFMLQYLLSGQ